MPRSTDREMLKRKRCRKDLDKIHSKILKAKKKLVRFVAMRFSHPREYPRGLLSIHDLALIKRGYTKSTLYIIIYIRHNLSASIIDTSFKKGKRTDICTWITSFANLAVFRYRLAILKDIHYTYTFIHIDRGAGYKLQLPSRSSNA